VIEGVGCDRVPANFARALALPLDGALRCSDAEAVAMSRYLLAHEGLFLGPSSALNCVGAVKAGRALAAARPAGAPDVVVAATGAEVVVAIEGAKKLAAEGVRAAVASLPCLEIFEEQALAYRETILPKGVPVVSIEASAVRGWERYAHAHLGLKTFGASAPAGDLMKYFGLTADGVAEKAKKVIAAYGKAAPLLPVNGPDF
jgi:hypothetical protein